MAYQQQKLIYLSFGGWEVQGQGAGRSCLVRACFPDSHIAAHVGRGQHLSGASFVVTLAPSPVLQPHDVINYIILNVFTHGKGLGRSYGIGLMLP